MLSTKSRIDGRLRHLIADGSSRHIGARYGIEIELEQVRPANNMTGRMYEQLHSLLSTHWRSDIDGSLRDGGIELISNPLLPSEISPAIEAAYAWADQHGKGPSVRCGMHVHVNMAGHTADHFSEILGAYILAEPYIFAFAGEEREQSIYCVPWYLDHNQYTAAAGLVRELRTGNIVGLQSAPEMVWASKYSALNMLPLFKQHTIEYRHAKSFTTAAEALRWAQLIQAVSERAPWVASRPNKLDAVLELMTPFTTEEMRNFAQKRLDAYDVVERYDSFVSGAVPCTYKAVSWGMPAVLEAVARGKPEMVSKDRPSFKYGRKRTPPEEEAFQARERVEIRARRAPPLTATARVEQEEDFDDYDDVDESEPQEQVVEPPTGYVTLTESLTAPAEAAAWPATPDPVLQPTWETYRQMFAPPPPPAEPPETAMQRLHREQRERMSRLYASLNQQRRI